MRERICCLSVKRNDRYITYFILLYAYGWFKKNSERSVYMNSRMLSLMLHTAIKVTIIAGIVHVSMITAMFLAFITIK